MIVGITDRQLVVKLLEMKEASLDAVREIIKVHEMIKRQMDEINTNKYHDEKRIPRRKLTH